MDHRVTPGDDAEGVGPRVREPLTGQPWDTPGCDAECEEKRER